MPLARHLIQKMKKERWLIMFLWISLCFPYIKWFKPMIETIRQRERFSQRKKQWEYSLLSVVHISIEVTRFFPFGKGFCSLCKERTTGSILPWNCWIFSLILRGGGEMMKNGLKNHRTFKRKCLFYKLIRKRKKPSEVLPRSVKFAEKMRGYL